MELTPLNHAGILILMTVFFIYLDFFVYEKSNIMEWFENDEQPYQWTAPFLNAVVLFILFEITYFTFKLCF